MLQLLKRKVTTMFTRPHIAMRKYFRRYVLREIFPLYNENYDDCWGSVDYKDKVVLDLGADYGSTAYYFLKHGAKRVVAVEGDPPLASQLLTNYDNHPQVECVYGWIDAPKGIEFLIRRYCAHPSCDLAKVDIEGAEKHIAMVDPQWLLSIREWLIEVHKKEDYVQLVKVFRDLGFRVFDRKYDMVGVHRIIRCVKE